MAGLTSIQLAGQLERAMATPDALSTWLGHRGYVPDPEGLRPAGARLAGVVPFRAADAHLTAPRLWVLHDATRTARSIDGASLRRLQRDADTAHRPLAAADSARAPHLFCLACRDFIILFPLTGDPYARRQRFTAQQLSHAPALAERFAAFSAANLATWAVSDTPAPPPDLSPEDADAWREMLALSPLAAALRFDFTRLYGSERLDEQFVLFVSHERARLVSSLLDPARATQVFEPMVRALRPEGPVSAVAELANDPLLRKQIVAAVDTVLLRLVLYRYLEAQHAEVDAEERGRIGLVRLDELTHATTRVDTEAYDRLIDAVRRTQGGLRRPEEQLDFIFAPPSVTVSDPARFAEGIRQASAHYQQSAGGDLHRGRLAAAADVLFEHLLTEASLRDAFATLIEGTNASRYSFNYEDLDPRAFQRFYEETIGTDIGVDIHDGRVRVVPRQRNRKEQGAYFTDERLCRHLVERTLGRWFAEFTERLHRVLPPGVPLGPEALPALRPLLDELCQVTVIDPTCGGGIFLRTAFERMTTWREPVAERLGAGLTAAGRQTLSQHPSHKLLLPEADPGAWEWHLLLHSLYGVDIDVKAINVASNMLTLSALTYRTAGLAFPSFINTNLKRGNALVSPLAASDRAAFAARHRETLRQLLTLRTELRSPRLSLERWRALDTEAMALTRQVTVAELERGFGDLFPGLSPEVRLQRIDQVGVCLYEVEFPEVFFTPEAALRPDAGFSIVLGNPPWEAPAKQYKHFLPEYDPEYRDLDTGAAAQREAALLANPEIARRWDSFCVSVDDLRALLQRSAYQHQTATVKGRREGSQNNLYAYATEMSWRLLGSGGMAGLVLDAGLWNDLSCVGLRRLLLDQNQVLFVAGLANNSGIFPDVHRSYKFTLVAFRNEGNTQSFPAAFFLTTYEEVDQFDMIAATIDAGSIRGDNRQSYPVPEVRSTEHWEFERSFGAVAALSDAPWHLETYSRELHANDQRNYFLDAEPERHLLPLIQGTQFNHWGVQDGGPIEKWIDPGVEGAGGFLRDRQRGRIMRSIGDALGATKRKEDVAKEWLRAVTGAVELPDEWLRLDWDDYRIAWRDIARNDDRRTLIVGIIPPRCALTHTAPFVRSLRPIATQREVRWQRQHTSSQMLYLAGMLSSYACDAVVRSRHGKTHLTAQTLLGLPVPPWADTPVHRRIADLTARLTCRPATVEKPWADYTALAAEVGLTPARDGLVDLQQRREAEYELNALANQLYGLSRQAFRFSIETLFDTPAHRDTHFIYRDAILARGWQAPPANGALAPAVAPPQPAAQVAETQAAAAGNPAEAAAPERAPRRAKPRPVAEATPAEADHAAPATEVPKEAPRATEPAIPPTAETPTVAGTTSTAPARRARGRRPPPAERLRTALDTANRLMKKADLMEAAELAEEEWLASRAAVAESCQLYSFSQGPGTRYATVEGVKNVAVELVSARGDTGGSRAEITADLNHAGMIDQAEYWWKFLVDALTGEGGRLRKSGQGRGTRYHLA